MDILIGVGLVLGMAVILLFRGKKNNLAESEKLDAKLEVEQDLKMAELKELENRLKDVEGKIKNLNSKQVEDYWNDENNS